MNSKEDISTAVYSFIKSYRKLNRKSPTIREIAHSCSLSVGGVVRHLDWLEAKGKIERNERQARSIIPTEEDA